MTLSAKWTAVSFFTLTALGAASFAFAGCTVTSGTIDDKEGGTGLPTDKDSSTAPDTSTGDGGVNACPGNTKQTTIFLNGACQTALEGACCAQLTACFDIVPGAGDAGAGGTDDCNKYSECIPKCRFQIDGTTPETDEKKISDCQDDCDLASSQPVISAYEAIVTCVTANPSTNSACQ